MAISTAKFTPGIWTFKQTLDQRAGRWIRVAGDILPSVAQVTVKRKEWRANAHLVSAAPDLFRALDGLMDAIRTGTNEEIDAAYAVAMDAMDKAHGLCAPCLVCGDYDGSHSPGCMVAAKGGGR